MAVLRPLVLDPAGFPRVLGDDDVLSLGGPGGGLQHVSGDLSFFGGPTLAGPGVLDGTIFQTLDQLITTLTRSGLVLDRRPADWLMSVMGLGQVAQINPFVTGRLVVGSAGGWTALDLPAQQPGVLQVPARVGDVLAYAPAITYGSAEPLRPAAGCLWFDTTTPGNLRLKIWSGTAWMDGLNAVLAGIATAGPPGVGDLLIGGVGGTWTRSSAGAAGSVLSINASGQPVYESLVYVQQAPPWPDGDAVVHRNGAIWADPSVNAEMFGFWDEGQKAWRRGYVNAPVLDRLAELRSSFLQGDMLFWGNNQMQRLPVGTAGMVLRTRSGLPTWERQITIAATQPTGGLTSQLWLDTTTNVVKVHDGTRWITANGTTWQDANASGAALTSGRVVYLEGGWKLATVSPASSKRFRGIVVTSGVAGAPVEVASSGMVSLTAAEWSSAIDPSDPTRPATGLNPGTSYWLSTAGGGLLTSVGSSGILIGTALNGTTLFLAGGNTAAAASGGDWLLGALDPGWPGSLMAGDLMAWNGSRFGAATTINGARVTVALRSESALVDRTTGAVLPPGTASGVAKAPTASGLLVGTTFLGNGELQLGTSPVDPALFWRLSDGTTTKLSRQDMARTYNLVATDLASDPDAAMVELVDSTGITQSVVLRGADGIEVTRTNAGTLAISGAGLATKLADGVDGGRFSPFSDPPPVAQQTNNYVIFKTTTGP